MRISDWSSDVCSSDLREGIALAKQRGAYRGRKKMLSEERVAELVRRVGDGERKSVIARDMGISRETLYQYLRAVASTREGSALLRRLAARSRIGRDFEENGRASGRERGCRDGESTGGGGSL